MPIKIAATNEMAAATAEYLKDGKIHRNIIYSIDATLAGRGYDDPTVPPTDLLNCLLRQRFLIGVAQINLQLSNNIYFLNNNQKGIPFTGSAFFAYIILVIN